MVASPEAEAGVTAVSRRAPVAGRRPACSRLERLEPDELLALVVGRRWFSASGGTPERALLTTTSTATTSWSSVSWRCASQTATPGRTSSHSATAASRRSEDLPALARLLALAGVDSPCASVRPAGTDQSNSAVVVDESVVLKVYRRIEPGPAVEDGAARGLEALRLRPAAARRDRARGRRAPSDPRDRDGVRARRRGRLGISRPPRWHTATRRGCRAGALAR